MFHEKNPFNWYQSPAAECQGSDRDILQEEYTPILSPTLVYI